MSHRLLIAEDNVAMAQVEKFALESAGYEVIVTHNGQIAWDELNASRFDLVLADEQMPRMTGRELRKNMCNDDRLAGIPFILLTAKRWEIDVEETVAELDIERMIAKPFSPTELVETVNSVLA